ncbi:50S ribosomal protein L11 [Candidatus Micrarchaeota archaeon]|nr:50S ribosomal protein L11 [Candidatus Micrarchaeota archaeon]MBI5176855.1 50S ribosomal protein L11 [Candidatus Micrarchaeota archaeon]
MAKTTIAAMVEGGKASAAPPLGPALGPSGLPINDVIAKINEKTKDFAGMQVPVKVEFEKGSKAFEITVGTPPTSALVKKELGLAAPVKEEAGVKGKKAIGNLTIAQVKKIASMKGSSILAHDAKGAVKEVCGTCLSLGATVEGKSPKEVMKLIDEGKFDKEF